MNQKVRIKDEEDRPSSGEPRKTPIRLVIILIVSIFVIETLSHTVTDFLWPMHKLGKSVFDSILLIALLSPVLYFFVLRPLNRSLAARKRAEEGMSKLAAIVKSSDDAIISGDLDGKILSWNKGAERIYGYSAEEIEGRHASVLALGDRSHEFPDIMEKIRRGERVEHYETIRKKKDGKDIPVSITASPIRDERGRVVGISAIARDITERKQALEVIQRRTTELEAANKELEAFSYSASHDLRTPLIAIGGFTRILLRDYATCLDDKGKKFLAMISKKTDLMRQLIDDLLAFSRSSHQALKESTINMNELAGSIVEDLKLVEPERVFQCILRPLPPVRGDEGMIRQVLMNLLANAMKFTRPKPNPVIEVGAREEDRANIYFVRDNGVGFDGDEAPKLFEVFRRLQHSQEFEGSGVGLAIVQRIIQRHGGNVWAEGKAGEGATFYFSLPK